MFGRERRERVGREHNGGETNTNVPTSTKSFPFHKQHTMSAFDKTPKTKNTARLEEIPPEIPPVTTDLISYLCKKPPQSNAFMQRINDWNKALNSGRETLILPAFGGIMEKTRLELNNNNSGGLTESQRGLLQVLEWAINPPPGHTKQDTDLKCFLFAMRELCDNHADGMYYKAVYARFILECIIYDSVGVGRFRTAATKIELGTDVVANKLDKVTLKKILLRHIVGVSKEVASVWVDAFEGWLDVRKSKLGSAMKELVYPMFCLYESTSETSSVSETPEEQLPFWFGEATACRHTREVVVLQDDASTNPTSTGSVVLSSTFMDKMACLLENPSIVNIAPIAQELDALRPGWNLEARLSSQMAAAYPGIVFQPISQDGDTETRTTVISPTSIMDSARTDQGDAAAVTKKSATEYTFGVTGLCQNPLIRAIAEEVLEHADEDEQPKLQEELRAALAIPLAKATTNHQKAISGQLWLSNKTEVASFIDAGSFGCVFKSHPKGALEKKAATKYEIVSTDELFPVFISPFLCHASVSHHPNFAQLFAFSLEKVPNSKNILVGIVMERCICNLGAELEVMSGKLEEDAISEDDFIEWIESALHGVLSGLEFIHSKGIMHRDLKPANVLRGVDGRCKIADMGSAKEYVADGMTKKAGTPEYMVSQSFSPAIIISLFFAGP